MKTTLKTFAAVAGLAMVSMPAQSQTLWDSLVSDTLNTYEDQNREIIIDLDDSGGVSTGDVFTGFVRIDSHSIPTGYPILENDLYAVFTLEVESIASTDFSVIVNGVTYDYTAYTINYKPTTVSGLTMSDLTDGDYTGSDAYAAVYEGVNMDLIAGATSPGDLDGDGALTIFDFMAEITNDDLDLVVGEELSTIDHWVSSSLVLAGATNDPIANLALLEDLTLNGGIPGSSGTGIPVPTSIGFHAGMGVLYTSVGDEDCTPTSDFCFARAVSDLTLDYGLLAKYELTIQNGDISGASDIFWDFNGGSVNPFFGTWVDGDDNGWNYYGVSSNADFSLLPTSVPEPSLIALMGMGFLAMGFVRRRTSARS